MAGFHVWGLTEICIIIFRACMTQKSTDMTVFSHQMSVTSRIFLVGKGQQREDGHSDNFLLESSQVLRNAVFRVGSDRCPIGKLSPNRSMRERVYKRYWWCVKIILMLNNCFSWFQIVKPNCIEIYTTIFIIIFLYPKYYGLPNREKVY